MGSGAKSYMRKGLQIYEEMRKYFTIYDPSEFPYIWGKFYFLFYQCTRTDVYTPWGTTRPYLLSISALIYSIFFIPITILLPLHLLFLANLLSFLLPQLLFSILCSLLQLFFYFFFTSSQPLFYIFFTSSTSILLSWCFSSTSSTLFLWLFFYHFVCSFTWTILLPLSFALLFQLPTSMHHSILFFSYSSCYWKIRYSSLHASFFFASSALILYNYPFKAFFS